MVFTDKHTSITKANMMAVVIGGIFTIPISIEQTDKCHEGVCTTMAPPPSLCSQITL